MGGGRRILVIKFSALGDFVQAFGAFETIRKAHADAEITLLTTPPYAELARASGLFDRIETDGRPEGLAATLALFRRLRRAGYARVYDLQTSSRSKGYRAGFFPRFPEWSGISPGASHRQRGPERERMHNLDRLADQLHIAGIGPAFAQGEAPAPDLAWAVRATRGDHPSAAERFGLSPPYALLIPGVSPGRTEKLWPTACFAALAGALAARGLQVVVAGGPGETPLARMILEAAPGAVDLTGATRMVDLAGLGAEAALCVTNDTGPGHMAAYAGAPGLMLMSAASSPRHYAPRAAMRTLQVEDLTALTPEAVLEALGELAPGHGA
jgi:ADP-heptose:LPS heptosyltransferase